MEAATLFFSEVASILPNQLSFSLPSLISSCETKFSYPENITITSKPPTRVISTNYSRVSNHIPLTDAKNMRQYVEDLPEKI